MTAAVMLQGTGSDVGKSLIAAGLARAYRLRGLTVAPFKPQNMSNNAAVTADGGEIGRAQALQARAAGMAPSVHMNPVLLKPESPTGAQVIVHGRRDATLSARDYMAARPRLLPKVLDSFAVLAAAADLVIVEGAGSPAELNLRDGDIANMGFARAADVPVILVGDIHRGGILAQIAGTVEILDPADAHLVRGFIVNKFHGDVSLFGDGVAWLEARTGRPCLGVVPHFAAAARLPAEDAVALDTASERGSGGLHVAVLRLPRIANFDDLDPLRLEPGVTVSFVGPGEPVPAAARLVVVPGSKSTVADLAAVRAEGWDIDLRAHVRRGGHVLGLCGGYQMLGRRIHDPDGLEGPAGSVDGLGLLDVETVLAPDKRLATVDARHAASGAAMTGYEIHLGRTDGPDCARPFAHVGDRPEGAVSATGRVAGTYLHGCFAADGFRRAFLTGLGATASDLVYETAVEQALDGLAGHLEAHLDLDRILAIAHQRRP